MDRFSKKYSNTVGHENPSSGSRVVPCGRTDRQTDMLKLISFFAVLRAPLKICISIEIYTTIVKKNDAVCKRREKKWNLRDKVKVPQSWVWLSWRYWQIWIKRTLYHVHTFRFHRLSSDADCVNSNRASSLAKFTKAAVLFNSTVTLATWLPV